MIFEIPILGQLSRCVSIEMMNDDDDDDDNIDDDDDNVSLLVTISRTRFISQEESDYYGKQLFIASCDDVTATII